MHTIYIQKVRDYLGHGKKGTGSLKCQLEQSAGWHGPFWIHNPEAGSSTYVILRRHGSTLKGKDVEWWHELGSQTH